MSSSVQSEYRTEEHLKFTEKVAVKLMSAVGDI
jgi:hypothetical protein